jgi:hypothetical protein
MSRQPTTPTWPFLLILAGLFVLAVAAPREWEVVAHTRRADTRSSKRTRAAAAPSATGSTASAHTATGRERPVSPAAQPRATTVALAVPPLAHEDPPVLIAVRSTNVPSANDPSAAAQPQEAIDNRGPVVSEEPSTPAPSIERTPLLGLALRPAQEMPQRDWRMPAMPARGRRRARVERVPALWATPTALLEHLESLAWDCESCVWACRASDLLRELAQIDDVDCERAEPILAELRSLADGLISPSRPAATSRSPQLERARHALARRLELWELVGAAPVRVATPMIVAKNRPERRSRQELAQCVREVAAVTERGAVGETWRQFLLLDQLQRVADERAEVEVKSARVLACRVLTRIERAPLDDRQRRFVASGAVARLSHELRRWSEEPVDPRQLLAEVEEFEQTGLPSDGRRLARHARATTFWPTTPRAGERIENWLEANYRNSNLRLAVSAELLNRLVPKQPPMQAPVRDRILGVPTRGTSMTTAELGVRLIPDPKNLRFALEAKGLIFARTTSKSGPATFYNHSDSTFVARKIFEIGPSGMRTWPAAADATNSPRLRDVRTDYDDVPLVGRFVQRIARDKHAENEGAVRRIARQKVTSRVEEEMDTTVEPRVNGAMEKFRRRVIEPLEGLALAPTTIEMQTDENRLTMRLRLASDDQLAAFTPRPRAPGDSLASAQIHQSLLNNVGERLQLDGHSFSLPQLQQRLAESFRLPPEIFTEEFPEDLRIGFAAENSVRARFIEGRIELTLAIAELHRHPVHWHDFTVRVYYKPRYAGLDLRFVRDGTVQLRGAKFGRQPQIALRGIFSKIFSQDRGLAVIDPKLVNDTRLADLAITQCVVTDGWLGFAVGPRRPAQRPNVARAKPQRRGAGF